MRVPIVTMWCSSVLNLFSYCRHLLVQCTRCVFQLSLCVGPCSLIVSFTCQTLFSVFMHVDYETYYSEMFYNLNAVNILLVLYNTSSVNTGTNVNCKKDILLKASCLMITFVSDMTNNGLNAGFKALKIKCLKSLLLYKLL